MRRRQSANSVPELQQHKGGAMTRGNSRIFNDNKPANYFWQMANIVDDLGLSVYAFRLYSRLVRISSLHNVDVSTRALAEACKMSMGSVSNAKAELIDAGLISIAKKPSGRGEDYDEIHILDITERNVKHCATRFTSSPHELTEVHSSPHERISSPDELTVHHMNVKVHQVNTLQEQYKKEGQKLSKEVGEGAPKPAIDHDAAARAAGIDKQPPPPRKSKKVEPPKAPTITTEQLQHFAVSAHREIVGVLLDAFCVQQIISRVTDETSWRECLTDWRLHTNWRTDNIAGQLDRYARWAEIKAQSASAPPLKRPEPINGAPAGTLTGAAKIAQETYERQMGGIQSAVEAAMAGGWYGNA